MCVFEGVDFGLSLYTYLDIQYIYSHKSCHLSTAVTNFICSYLHRFIPDVRQLLRELEEEVVVCGSCVTAHFFIYVGGMVLWNMFLMFHNSWETIASCGTVSSGASFY